jgi:hypothetical protein
VSELIGYARCSNVLQDLTAQRQALVGNEMARADLKQGRAGARAPVEVLDDFRWTGGTDDLLVWREYERATKGRQAITWSKALHQLLAVEPHRVQNVVPGLTMAPHWGHDWAGQVETGCLSLRLPLPLPGWSLPPGVRQEARERQPAGPISLLAFYLLGGRNLTTGRIRGTRVLCLARSPPARGQGDGT